MSETLTVEKDKVLAAMEKCPTFKAIAETLWPGLAEQPHKFKVGDRVTYVNYVGPTEQSGTVRVIMGGQSSPYGVEFDKGMGGHSLDGRCKDDHGWWCKERDLSPEEKWGDVTDRVTRYMNDVELQASVPYRVQGLDGVPFKLVMNEDSAFLDEFKIENGRAYHRKG